MVVGVWCKNVLVWTIPVHLLMRVCSSINLSVLLENSPFNITLSWSVIEWSGLLKCLANGSPLLLSLMLFCDCS